jgi:DNA-directed RNA polymerase subunit RPC12/RpoP
VIERWLVSFAARRGEELTKPCESVVIQKETATIVSQLPSPQQRRRHGPLRRRLSVAQYLEGRRANVLGPPAPRSGARITTQHVSAGQEPTAPVRDAGPTARQRLERARILTADPPPPTGAELTSIHYRRLSPPRSEDHVIYRCPRCGARNEVKLGFTGEPSCGACGYSLSLRAPRS